MRLFYIEWVDAVSNSGWFSHKDLEKWIDEGGFVCKEVGWIFKEDKKQITLVSRWSPNPPNEKADETRTEYGLCQLIPKPWILKRVDLTRHVPKKKG